MYSKNEQKLIAAFEHKRLRMGCKRTYSLLENVKTFLYFYCAYGFRDVVTKTYLIVLSKR